jgi:hypothetical protein
VEGWHDAGVTTDPLAGLSELPGVFEGVDAARASIDGLLREPALRRGRGEVRAESRRRAAWASARLAGAEISLEEFAAPFASDDAGRACSASLRMAGAVREISTAWRQAPLQALARLHTLAAADLVEADDLGRPRADPATAARLAALAEVVTRSQAPGIVVAAIVHGEVLSLEPFVGGNGLVARAAMRVVLVARGVDPDALTVPEEGLLELGADRYATTLDGYTAGGPEGLAAWLQFNAAAIQQGATIARQICRSR